MKIKITCVVLVFLGLVAQGQTLCSQFFTARFTSPLLHSGLCTVWPVVVEEKRSVRFVLRVIDSDGHPLAGAEIYRRRAMEEEVIGVTDAFGGWQKSLLVTDKNTLFLAVRKSTATGLLRTIRQFHVPAGHSEWHRTVQLDNLVEIR